MSDLANNNSELKEAREMINEAIEKIKKIFSENDTVCLGYFEKIVASAFGLKIRQIRSNQKSADLSSAKALIIFFVRENSQLKTTALANHFGITRRQVERLYKSINDMLVHPNGNKRLFEKYSIVKNQYQLDYGKKQ